MTWRYQPVWVENGNGERLYTVTSVQTDAHGRLTNWLQAEVSWPRGAGEIAKLRDCLARMLMDANLYKPVAFSSLKAGMMFERVDE